MQIRRVTAKDAEEVTASLTRQHIPNKSYPAGIQMAGDSLFEGDPADKISGPPRVQLACEAIKPGAFEQIKPTQLKLSSIARCKELDFEDVASVSSFYVYQKDLQTRLQRGDQTALSEARETVLTLVNHPSASTTARRYLLLRGSAVVYGISGRNRSVRGLELGTGLIDSLFPEDRLPSPAALDLLGKSLNGSSSLEEILGSIPNPNRFPKKLMECFAVYQSPEEGETTDVAARGEKVFKELKELMDSGNDTLPEMIHSIATGLLLHGLSELPPGRFIWDYVDLNPRENLFPSGTNHAALLLHDLNQLEPLLLERSYKLLQAQYKQLKPRLKSGDQAAVEEAIRFCKNVLVMHREPGIQALLGGNRDRIDEVHQVLEEQYFERKQLPLQQLVHCMHQALQISDYTAVKEKLVHRLKGEDTPQASKAIIAHLLATTTDCGTAPHQQIELLKLTNLEAAVRELAQLFLQQDKGYCVARPTFTQSCLEAVPHFEGHLFSTKQQRAQGLLQDVEKLLPLCVNQEYSILQPQYEKVMARLKQGDESAIPESKTLFTIAAAMHPRMVLYTLARENRSYLMKLQRAVQEELFPKGQLPAPAVLELIHRNLRINSMHMIDDNMFASVLIEELRHCTAPKERQAFEVFLNASNFEDGSALYRELQELRLSSDQIDHLMNRIVHLLAREEVYSLGLSESGVNKKPSKVSFTADCIGLSKNKELYFLPMHKENELAATLESLQSLGQLLRLGGEKDHLVRRIYPYTEEKDSFKTMLEKLKNQSFVETTPYVEARLEIDDLMESERAFAHKENELAAMLESLQSLRQLLPLGGEKNHFVRQADPYEEQKDGFKKPLEVPENQSFVKTTPHVKEQLDVGDMEREELAEEIQNLRNELEQREGVSQKSLEARQQLSKMGAICVYVREHPETILGFGLLSMLSTLLYLLTTLALSRAAKADLE